MTVIVPLVACLSAACLSAAAALSPQVQPPDMVVISGKTEPEKLPEYVVWRNGFDVLASAVQADKAFVLDSLKLTSNDREVALKEATAEAEREQSCRVKQERVIEQARKEKLPLERSTEQLNAVVLACRYQVLDAKDRLMTALSLEGRAELERWVLERRRGLKVFIQKHELEFFRKPR